jgi:V/A-type H+-transporting ATPase subunit I
MMGLRPEAARWFELLTSRADLTLALETLAATGSIELETHSDSRARLDLPDLRDRMDEYNRLARRYHPYWPQPEMRSSFMPASPIRLLDRALQHLRSWEDEVAPRIHHLESLSGEQSELQLLETMLLQVQDDTLDFGLLAKAGPELAVRLFVLPPGSRIEHFPAALLVKSSSSARHDFLRVVGLRADIEALAVELAAHKARAVTIPPFLHGSRIKALVQVKNRLQELNLQLRRTREQIGTWSERYQVSEALSDIARLEWFMTHVTNLPVSENFAWVTGWTDDLGGERLKKALAEAGVKAILDFPQAPAEARAPMVMQNPWWAQPFELFARMLGTPAADEADPSRLLAVLAPLLFGYMFGDVGHGLVLVVVGLLYQKRWPVLRILIANGVAAMIFGFVFGSVFGREDIIAALWLHPMDDPLPVLFVPLGGGVLVLLLGLVLNAVELYWRGEWLRWVQVEAAVVVLYLSMIAAFFMPRLVLVSAAAMVWFFAGSLLQGQGKWWMALVSAGGSLLESVFQLLVNTVSFVRVGAFALAHGGLSLAFITLAAATDSMIAGMLILLLGNLIVIMLEGLVVTIQTTRLILFEFFIRFLQGTGRMFRPLAAPADNAGIRRKT